MLEMLNKLRWISPEYSYLQPKWFDSICIYFAIKLFTLRKSGPTSQKSQSRRASSIQCSFTSNHRAFNWYACTEYSSHTVIIQNILHSFLSLHFGKLFHHKRKSDDWIYSENDEEKNKHNDRKKSLRLGNHNLIHLLHSLIVKATQQSIIDF